MAKKNSTDWFGFAWLTDDFVPPPNPPDEVQDACSQDTELPDTSKGVELNPSAIDRSSETKSVSSVAVDIAASASSDSETHTLSEEKVSNSGNICDKRNKEIQLGSAVPKFTPPTTPTKIIGSHSAIKQSPKRSCSVESSPINQCSVVIKKNPVLENLPRQSSFENVFAYVNDKIEIKHDHDFEKHEQRERKVSSSESESSVTSIQRQNSIDKKTDQMVYNADIEVRKSGRLKSAKCASRYRGDYGIRAEVYTKLTKKDKIESIKECTLVDAPEDIANDTKKIIISDHKSPIKTNFENVRHQIECQGSTQNNSSTIMQNASQKNGKPQPIKILKQPQKHQKSNKISIDENLKDSEAVTATNMVVDTKQNLKGKQESNFDYTVKEIEPDLKIDEIEKQVEPALIKTRRSSARSATLTQIKSQSKKPETDSLGSQKNDSSTTDTSNFQNTEIMVKDNLKGTDQKKMEKVSDKHTFVSKELQQETESGQTEKHIETLIRPTHPNNTHMANSEVENRKSNKVVNLTSNDQKMNKCSADETKLKDTVAVNKKKVTGKEEKTIQKQRKSGTCTCELQGVSKTPQADNQGEQIILQTHTSSAIKSDGYEAKLDVKHSGKNQENVKQNFGEDEVENSIKSELNRSEQNDSHPLESTMKGIEVTPHQAVINKKSKTVSKERSKEMVARSVTKTTTTHLNDKLGQKRSVAILNQKNMHRKKKVGPILRTHLTLQTHSVEEEKDKDLQAEEVITDMTVNEQLQMDDTGTRHLSYIDSHDPMNSGSNAETVALNDASVGIDHDLKTKTSKRDNRFQNEMPLTVNKSENVGQKMVVCDKPKKVPSQTESKQPSMSDQRKYSSGDSDLEKPCFLNETKKNSETHTCTVKKGTAGICSSKKPETQANSSSFSYSVTKFYMDKDKKREQNLVTEIKQDVPVKDVTGIPVTTHQSINQLAVSDNSVSVLESLRLRLFASAGIKPVEVVDKPKVFESKIKQPKLKTVTNSENSQSCFQSGRETLLNNSNKTSSDSEINKAGMNSSKSSNKSGHSTPRSTSPSSEILDEVSKTLESLQKAKQRKNNRSVQKSIQPRFSQKMFMLRSMFPKHTESDSESHSSVTTEQSDDSLREDKDSSSRDIKESKSTDSKSGTRKYKQKKLLPPSKEKCSQYSRTNAKSVENVEKMVKCKSISSKLEKAHARKQLVKQKPVKCHACGHVFKSKELLKKHYPCRMRQTRTWSQNKLRPNRVFRYVEKPAREQGSKRFICLLPKSKKQDQSKSRPQLLTIRKTKFRRVKGKRRRKLYMILQGLAEKRRPRTYPHLCINYESLTNKSQFLYKLGLFDSNIVDSSSLEDSFNSSVASFLPSDEHDKRFECELMQYKTQKDLKTDDTGHMSDSLLHGLHHTHRSFDHNRLSDFIDGKQKSPSVVTEVPPVLEKFEAPQKDVLPEKENATDSDSNGPPLLELQFESPTKKIQKERHFLDFVDSIARKDSALRTDDHTDLHPANSKITIEETTCIKDASNKSEGIVAQRHFTDFIDKANAKSAEQGNKPLMDDSALWEQSERGEMTLAEIKEMLKPKSRKENEFSKETLLKLRSDLDKFLSGFRTPRKMETSTGLPEKKQESLEENQVYSQEKNDIEKLGIDLSSYERKSLFETLENVEQHGFESQVSVDDGSCAESELSSTSEQPDTYKSSPEYEQDLLPQSYGDSDILENTTKGCITDNILQMLSTLEDKGSVAENMTNLLQILAENLGITNSSNSNSEEVSQEVEDISLVEDPMHTATNHLDTNNALSVTNLETCRSMQNEVSKETDDCTQSSKPVLQESLAENAFNLTPEILGTNELNSATESREKIPDIVIQSQTELHSELSRHPMVDTKQHQKEDTEMKKSTDSTLFKSITELNSIETDSDSNLGDSFDAVIMSKRLAELKATGYDASSSDINSDLLSDSEVAEKSKQINKEHMGLNKDELLVPERPVLCDSPTRQPYDSDVLESEEEPSKVVEERPRLIMKIKIPAGASFEMTDDSSHKDSSSCTSASAKSSDASDIEDLGKSEEDTLAVAESGIESNVNNTITTEEIESVTNDQEVHEVTQGLSIDVVKTTLSSDRGHTAEAEDGNNIVPKIEDLVIAKLSDEKVCSLKSDAEAISEKEIMFPRKLKLNTALTIGDSFDYESDSSSSFERDVTVTPHVGTSPKPANNSEMQFSNVGLKSVHTIYNNKGGIKDSIAEQNQMSSEDYSNKPVEAVKGKHTDLSSDGESDGTITSKITTDFKTNQDPLLRKNDSTEIENQIHSTGEPDVVTYKQLFENSTDGKTLEALNCTEDSGKIMQNLVTDTERMSAKNNLTSYFNDQSELIGTTNEEENILHKSDMVNCDTLTCTVTKENFLPGNDICTTDKINQEHSIINTNTKCDTVNEKSTEVSLDSIENNLSLMENMTAPKSFVPLPVPKLDFSVISTQGSFNNLCELDSNHAVDSAASDEMAIENQLHKNRTEPEIVQDCPSVIKVNFESFTHQEENVTSNIKLSDHESHENCCQSVSFLECNTQTNLKETFISDTQKEIIPASDESLSSARELIEHNQSYNINVSVHPNPESMSSFKVDTLTVFESTPSAKGPNESNQRFDSNTSNMPFTGSKMDISHNVSQKSNISFDISHAKYTNRNSITEVRKQNVQNKAESLFQPDISSSKTENNTSAIGSDARFSKKPLKETKPKTVKASEKETKSKIFEEHVVKVNNHKTGMEKRNDIDMNSKISTAENKDNSDQIINKNISKLCSHSEIVKVNAANVPIPHVIADVKSQSQAKPILKGSSVTDDNNELQNKKRRISVTDYLSRVKKGDKAKKNEEQRMPKVPFTLHDENKSSSEPISVIRSETHVKSDPEIIIDENMYESNVAPVTWHDFGNTRKALKESATISKQQKSFSLNKTESVSKDTGDTYKIFSSNKDSSQGLYDKEAQEKNRKSKRFVSMPLTKKSDIVTLEKSLNKTDKQKNVVLTDTVRDSTNQDENLEQDSHKAEDDVLSVFDSLFSLGETVLSLNKSEQKSDNDKPSHAEEGSLFSALDTLCKVGEEIISSGKPTEETSEGRSVNEKSVQTGISKNKAESNDSKQLIPEVIDLTETEDSQGSFRAYFLDLESWVSQSDEAKNTISSPIPTENSRELPTNILETAYVLDKLSGYSGIYLNRFRYNVLAFENEYRQLQVRYKEINEKSELKNSCTASSVAVVNVNTLNEPEKQIDDTDKTDINMEAHKEDENSFEQENNDLIEGVNEDYMDDDYADMLAAAQLALHEEAKSQNVESCPAKTENSLHSAGEIFTETGKRVNSIEEASTKTSPDEALAILNSLVKTLSADVKEIPVGSPENTAKKAFSDSSTFLTEEIEEKKPEITAETCEKTVCDGAETITKQIEKTFRENIETVSEEHQEILIVNARNDSVQENDDVANNAKKPRVDNEVLNIEASFTESQEILAEIVESVSWDTSKRTGKINDSSVLQEEDSIKETVKTSQQTAIKKNVENFEQGEVSNNDTVTLEEESKKGEIAQNDKIDETVSVRKDADSVPKAHELQHSKNDSSKNVETLSVEIGKEISQCAELPYSETKQALEQEIENSVPSGKTEENKEDLVKQTDECPEENEKGQDKQGGVTSKEIEVSLEVKKPLPSVNVEELKETEQEKLTVSGEGLCEDVQAGLKHSEEDVAITASNVNEASSEKDKLLATDDMKNLKANATFAADNQDFSHTDIASLEQSKKHHDSQESTSTATSEVGQGKVLYTKQHSLVSMDYDNVSDGSFSDIGKSEATKHKKLDSVVSKRQDDKERRHSSSMQSDKSPLHFKQSRGRKDDDVAPSTSEDDRRNFSEHEDYETHKSRKKVRKERKQSKSPEEQKYKIKRNERKKNRRKNVEDDYDTEDDVKDRRRRKKEKKKVKYSDSEQSDYPEREKHKKKHRSAKSPVRKEQEKQQYDEYYRNEEKNKDRKNRKSSEYKLSIKMHKTHNKDYENERNKDFVSEKVAKSDDEREIEKKKTRKGRKSSEDRISRNTSVTKEHKSEVENEFKKARQRSKEVESDDYDYHERRPERKKKREHSTSFEDTCMDASEAVNNCEQENTKKNRKKGKAMEMYDNAEFYKSRKEKSIERGKTSEERKYLKSNVRDKGTPTEIEADEYENRKQRKIQHESRRTEVKSRKNKDYLEMEHYKNPVYDDESKKEGKYKARLENERYKQLEYEKDRRKTKESKKSSERRNYEHDIIEKERKDVKMTKFSESSDYGYHQAHNSGKKVIKSKDLLEMEYNEYYESERKRKKNRKKRKSEESEDYKYDDYENRKRRKLSEALDDDYKSEKKKRKERKRRKSSDFEEYQYEIKKEKRKEEKNKKSEMKDSKYYEDDQDRNEWKKSAYIFEEGGSSPEYSNSSKKGKMLQSAVVKTSRDRTKSDSFERDRSDRNTDKHGRKSSKHDKGEMKLNLKSKSSR